MRQADEMPAKPRRIRPENVVQARLTSSGKSKAVENSGMSIDSTKAVEKFDASGSYLHEEDRRGFS